jgi:hypothetical protein
MSSVSCMGSLGLGSIFKVDEWTQPCIATKVCGASHSDWGEFIQRVDGLGKWRSRTTELNHGWNQECHRKGMVGFEFLHFLSVAMSYLKGNCITCWFKCNMFPRWNPVDLRVTQVVHIGRSSVEVETPWLGWMCGELGMTYLDKYNGWLGNIGKI